MLNEIIEYYTNLIDEFTKPEVLQYLMKQEFNSYSQINQYKPLISPNPVINELLLIIRECYRDKFKEIKTKIDQIIEEAYNNAELTEEQRIIMDEYIRKHMKIIPEFQDNELLITISFDEST